MDKENDKDNILSLSDFRKSSESDDMLVLSRKIYAFLIENLQDDQDMESAAKLFTLYARDMVELIYQDEEDILVRNNKITEIKKYLKSLLTSDGVLLNDKHK